MNTDTREMLKRLVERLFPDCLAAVWGGSASRNEPRPYSDLDIVIVDDTWDGPFRKTIRSEGWIVEFFALTSSTYRDFFDEGIRAAIPSLQHMLSEGVILRALPEGLSIIEEAGEDIRFGPMPWSSSERDHERYRITEYMEDLKGASSRWEVWFAANQLVDLVCKFVLRVDRQWIGEGKHLFRRLASYAPETAGRLEEALQALYAGGDRAPLLELGSVILLPYGGTISEGYEEG